MDTLFVFANKLENQLKINNENYNILISGMGQSSGYSLDKFLKDNRNIKKIVNIGICGCTNKTFPIFSCFSINKSLNISEKIKHHNNSIKELNVLSGLNFNTASCCTLEKIVNNKKTISLIQKTECILFDMETFYLKIIADKYNIPFFSLKIITDYGDIKVFDTNFKNIALKASSILCSKISKLLE